MNQVLVLPILSTVKYLLSDLRNGIKITKNFILLSIGTLLLCLFLGGLASIAFGTYVANSIAFAVLTILSRRYFKDLLLNYYKEQNIEVINYDNLLYSSYLLGFFLVVPIIFFIPAIFWGAIWNTRFQPIFNVQKDENYKWNFSSILRLVIISWIVALITLFILFICTIAVALGLFMLYVIWQVKYMMIICGILFVIFAVIFLTLIIMIWGTLIARLSFFIHLNFPECIQKNKLVAIN